MGIRILHGRDFLLEEMDGSRNVMIVTEGVTRRFWPGQDPIGKRIKPGRPDSREPWFQIVGVVNDINYRALPRNPTPDPDVFAPFNDRARNFAVMVRGRVDPSGLAGAIRNEVRNLDKSAVVYSVLPMTERVSLQMTRARFTTWLMGLFAGVALALAMIGIYGVMAHAVTQQTREIGIRMALGAARREVLKMIVRRALKLAGIGVAIGIVAALSLTHLLRTLLFGVSPTDPLVLGGVSFLLVLSAIFASWIPARRATRVDPMVALRYE